MATKTKATRESAPVVEKMSSPASAPEKKGNAKTIKASVAVQKPEQEVSTQAAEKPAAKVLPKVTTESDQAVPASQPVVMLNNKWHEIRIILEKLKDDTLREIRKSVKNGTEAVAAIEPGGDIYDQASSERDRELGLLLGDREREKIHSIDEALLRIDDGEYGICEECDEDIPLGRLKAMPFTRHCVKCKSDLEKLQAQTKRVEEERAYREIPMGSSEEEDS
jgi:DnaK suppressor protein